jgi:polyisoprenoid-binding protein YceI
MFIRIFASNFKLLKEMKTLFLAASLLALSATPITEWKADTYHSKIGFTVTHMLISEVTGRFDKFDITAKSDNPDFMDAVIDFTADAASVNTDNEMRDKHLKSDDFFNAEKYPKITFMSKSIKKIDAKHYKLSGDLTIRDKTKQVALDMLYNGTVKDMYGKDKAGFKVTGTINRKDYGLNWSKTVEAGAVVSDDVNIIANIEMGRK